LRIIQDYLSNIEVDADTRCTINQYLNLISKRAAGSLMTNAAWMRHIVTNHPAYKHDSVVTDEIAYDLLWSMKKISTGEAECSKVLPRMSSKTTLDVSAAVEKENNELEVKRLLMNQHNQTE
jgi:glutamate--cysteine ligase catalytic subunit